MPPNFFELPKAMAQLIKGQIWGSVWPPRASPKPLPTDGRTIALATLAQYISLLDVYRVGPVGGAPIKFRIPEEQFYPEWPDGKQSMLWPSIVVVHDDAPYDVIGLVSYVEEDSYGKFAHGTVVQWQGEYVEPIQLEIWCNTRAERRGILSALETAMSPTEQQSGVRFRMPGYYDQLVCFTLNSRKIIDQPDSAKGRRHAVMKVEMRFNVVALINATTMQPVVSLSTDHSQDGTPVSFRGDRNAQRPQGG